MKLAELAEKIGAELFGDPSIEISSCARLEEAGTGQVSFLANPKYSKQLEETHASAVVVSLLIKSDRLPLLKAKDPYFAFMKAVVALHGHRRHPHAGIHPQAHVDASATIGEGSVIYPGAYVGAKVTLGRDCILYPNAVVYEGCVLGDRVILQAGAVIGADGFGYATNQGVHHKIPQVGNVILEDDVEVGANACVDRAAMGSTIIGKGTKIDNLVTIGHGVKIGPYGMIVAQVGIAGSTTLGHHVTVAGQVGVSGHLKIGDKVTIGAQSGVIGDLEDNSIVMGSPALPALQTRRIVGAYVQLPDIMNRIKALEEKLNPQTEE